jgi:hypothetical protein
MIRSWLPAHEFGAFTPPAHEHVHVGRFNLENVDERDGTAVSVGGRVVDSSAPTCSLSPVPDACARKFDARRQPRFGLTYWLLGSATATEDAYRCLFNADRDMNRPRSAPREVMSDLRRITLGRVASGSSRAAVLTREPAHATGLLSPPSTRST